MIDPVERNLSLALNPAGGDAAGRIRERAIQYLVEHADVACPRLVAALKSAPAGLLAPALIDLLGRFRRPQSIPILERILLRGEESVARTAGQALGQFENASATPILAEALSSPFHETVIGASDGLLVSRDPAACPALRKAMQHPEANVRYHVVHAAWLAGCLDDTDRERLRRDADRSIRELAQQLIGDSTK